MLHLLDTLYRDRCYATSEGKLVPHFWDAKPLETTPFTLFGDDTTPTLPEWNVESCLRRILALNLELELPVGDFVLSATKRDLPDHPTVLPLLKSNVADEARHYTGIKHACNAYLPTEKDIEDAIAIRKLWENSADVYHPLLPACLLEVGVFLVVLGLLRVAGGRELATLSAKISQDEYRHVRANRIILGTLGIDTFTPPDLLARMTHATLDWVIQDLDIPANAIGETFNKDFLLKASDSLIATGEAEDFNEIVFMADHILPFENANSKQYDRVL